MVKVQILHSQAQAFRNPQTAPVDQSHHEASRPTNLGQHLLHFALTQHDRQVWSATCPHGTQACGILSCYLAQEEEDGAESLVLGGGGHAAPNSQMGQKCPCRVRRIPGKAVQPHEITILCQPGEIGLLCGQRVMAHAHKSARLIHGLIQRGRNCHSGTSPRRSNCSKNARNASS